MRKALAVMALILSSNAAVAEQQHAAVPKEAQCHADAQAWVISKAELAKLPMQELAARHDSMLACTTTDSSWKLAYQVVESFYELAMLDRMTDFLKRHDLMKQFLAEDAAGER